MLRGQKENKSPVDNFEAFCSLLQRVSFTCSERNQVFYVYQDDDSDYQYSPLRKMDRPCLKVRPIGYGSGIHLEFVR